ncbi:hypothetical protein SAMN04490182_2430 [Pseudomonas cedrina]|uniref:DUF1534 domain-containing protein n=1 Tax=Pseudomonas cedrina TaxID=651740 RepID=A0ABY0UK50_PSECE|nr:hypothetical protein SAMN04490182_2430 [Pseudomonas cedrina]
MNMPAHLADRGIYTRRAREPHLLVESATRGCLCSTFAKRL